MGLLSRYGRHLVGAPLQALSKEGHVFSTLPDARLQMVADDYAKQAGIDYTTPSTWAKINKGDATEYANAYDKMADTPGDKLTNASWSKMGDETLDQLQALLDAGYEFRFMSRDRSGNFVDPYAASPRLALEDLRQNKRMSVFPTEGGYGSLTEASAQSPLLRQVRGMKAFGGAPFVQNDAFRAVHDALGHAPMGAGFRAEGEENAFRHHALLYSDMARPGLTAETRGQNSWVNFGPHGEANRKASAADTVYADQKAGIMPDFVYNRGLDRQISTDELRKLIERGGLPALAALMAAGRVVVDHESGQIQIIGEDQRRGVMSRAA